MFNRALSLFKRFHGREPGPNEIRDVKGVQATVLHVGTLIAVAYEADIDGKTETYYHEFKKSSRPALFSSFDGSQLYIVAGRYKFTERGIEDK